MNEELIPPTDALMDRVHEWVKQALQRAVVAQIPENDRFGARVPGIRKCYAAHTTEGLALMDLEFQLTEYAKGKLTQGLPLPLFISEQQPAPPDVRGIVRMNRLAHELRERGKQWGFIGHALPPGSAEKFLHDMDALLSRHAAALGALR